MWLVCNKLILTNNEWARRGMTNDAGYGVCGSINETTLHALRDCQIAKNVWELVVPS